MVNRKPRYILELMKTLYDESHDDIDAKQILV